MCPEKLITSRNSPVQDTKSSELRGCCTTGQCLAMSGKWVGDPQARPWLYSDLELSSELEVDLKYLEDRERCLGLLNVPHFFSLVTLSLLNLRLLPGC